MDIKMIKGKGSIEKYLRKIDLFSPFVIDQPGTFDELENYLEKKDVIYWSYCEEDKNQIESDVFMVCVGKGKNKEIRYYELYETEQW